MDDSVVVIGAGLAGSEVAWQLARHGIKVRLFEAKPQWFSPAHKSEYFAELVCSNSLKSEQEQHATALLKEEMQRLNSIVIEAAHATRVPAGKALAVDRTGFSKYITDKLSSHSNIEIVHKEVKTLRATNNEQRATIIATGPLTSPSLIESFQSLLTHSSTYPLRPKRSEASALKHLFYFYDAIAPIVESDSVDMSHAFRASRYNVGKLEGGDYINCPLTRQRYYQFIDALIAAKKIETHNFEDIKCFEGCQPIEVMAAGHPESLRHGPMKPMGLKDPKTGQIPYAVVQLRQDNLHATLYNLVGFQTRMLYSEQDRVFRMIEGLQHAKFVRYGSMHRNTYINGPSLLDESLQLKSQPGIYIAGQLTGVEGYLESAATGLYIGLRLSTKVACPPFTTAIGSLINHVTHADPANYQPMNINWGIFPPLSTPPCRGPKKDERRQILLTRARDDFANWLKQI